MARVPVRAGFAPRYETFDDGLAPVLGDSTFVHSLPSIDEGLLVRHAIDIVSQTRVPQTSHHHLAVPARATAGKTVDARIALERKIDNVCTVVDRMLATALVDLDRQCSRDIEVYHAG